MAESFEEEKLQSIRIKDHIKNKVSFSVILRNVIDDLSVFNDYKFMSVSES